SGDADTDAKGISVSGGVGIGESLSQATLAPVTKALVSGGTNIDAQGGVTVSASHRVDGNPHRVTATASASGGGGLASVQGAEADATSSGKATAQVASGATITALGLVNVLASAGNRAEANAQGDSFGFVGVGGTHAEADDNGGASALLDGGVKVTALGVTVSAAAADYGSATTGAASGGVVSIHGSAPDGAGSFVNLKPTVIATIGGGDVIVAQGNVRVQAVDLIEGDGLSEGTGVGGVDVGSSDAEITIQP